MKKIFNIAAIAALLLGAFSCTQKELAFNVENDSISVDCNAQSVEFFIQSASAWKASTSEEWVKVVPSEGPGTGSNIDFIGVEIRTEYNTLKENRTAMVFFEASGKKIDVEITQGPCAFAIGAVKAQGTLTVGEESTATLIVAYEKASGEEQIAVSGTVSGVDGLSIASATYNTVQGSGEIAVPVVGTPAAEGTAVVTLTVDGVAKSPVEIKCSKKVEGLDPSKRAGLPVSFNNFALGLSGADSKTTPNYTTWTGPDHYMSATAGNMAATLKGVAPAATSWTFNPQIQIKNLKKDDYLLITVPVKHFSKGTKVSFEGAAGAAGKGAGFWVIEYSDDASTWHTAGGALQETAYYYGTLSGEEKKTVVCAENAPVHFWCTGKNISDAAYGTATRTTYDKATDDGYHKYSFTLDNISDIIDGNLYFRLRVALDQRAAICTEGMAKGSYDLSNDAWGDFKAVDIDFDGDAPAGGASVEGLPVHWEFDQYNGTEAMAGTNATDAANYIKNEAYCFWNTSNSYNEGAGLYGYYKDWSNKGAVLTCQVANKSAIAYGYGQGHCYMKGMVKNDAWVFIVPVKGLKGGTKLSFFVGVSASGSGPCMYALEFSKDGSSWTLAEGSSVESNYNNTDNGPVHFTVPNWDESKTNEYNQMLSNAGGEECGFKTVTFTLPSDFNIDNGNFYLRLRVSVDMRRSRAASTISATGSERLKGRITISTAN